MPSSTLNQQKTMEIIGRNYNQLAPKIYHYIFHCGIEQPSRNGPVLRIPGVVVMTVTRPWERVNTMRDRDANPFFHLMEAACMLAPLNDAQFLGHFAKNIVNYSDDGATFNAFYGTRLFERWGNQLEHIVEILSKDPTSRQCVAQVWDPSDLYQSTKDKACNVMAMFEIRDDQLNMTTINRSNDAIWGMVTGANVVHWSYFHEFVACALNLPMGHWTHVSNNLHVYVENPTWKALSTKFAPEHAEDLYDHPLWNPDFDSVPLFRTPVRDIRVDRYFQAREFQSELHQTLRDMTWCIKQGVTYCPKAHTLPFPWITDVLTPVFNTWQLRKADCHKDIVLRETELIKSKDWRIACQAWLERRYGTSTAK